MLFLSLWIVISVKVQNVWCQVEVEGGGGEDNFLTLCVLGQQWC